MMFIMWVYMETWIVKDGAAELGRGSYLPGVGLRADCLSLAPPCTLADGIAELADRGGSQRPGTHLHELTGTAGAARGVDSGAGPGQRDACWEFVITAGDQAFIARTAEPASLVAAGSRVTAQCILSVMADYAWDAFGLPDLRSDWQARRQCARAAAAEADRGHYPPSPRRRAKPRRSGRPAGLACRFTRAAPGNPH